MMTLLRIFSAAWLCFTVSVLADEAGTANRPPQEIVIVLDPGHGGKDPGAKGKHGTQEKNVVLSVAIALQAQLASLPGIRVYLTRETDVFIPLRDRLKIARDRKADFFIALHADAFRHARAHGASVFALSQKGATSESARWLAEKENASEELGGADLSDKDPVLKMVLIDMSQTATINTSLLLGQSILEKFGQNGALHSHKVEQAAFVVLKSPDIPSLLIENGFISNPTEEKALASPAYQAVLAKQITAGIIQFLTQNAPVDSIFYQSYVKTGEKKR